MNLDDVPWHAIDHAYGPALDTPGHVRALRSDDPEVVARAITDLDRTIHEEGGFVCGAATAVLPFLVEVLPSLALEPRTRLLDLLDRIAAWGDAEQVDAGWAAAWAKAQPALDRLRP
ncbi:hypothetical protein [Lentzea sp. CA-135723]|uniref:hypothetical protein n=1 Tax=Lentzea sp. CA-135723 TaxID=3239950 RepID=UPI003D912BFA